MQRIAVTIQLISYHLKIVSLEEILKLYFHTINSYKDTSLYFLITPYASAKKFCETAFSKHTDTM